MEETPTRAVQKFLKVLCLRRDDFRCLATGIPEKSAVKAGLVPLDPLRYACDTELTHIIPFAIGHGEDRDQVCQNLLLQSYKCWPTAGLQGVSDLEHSQKVLSANWPWSPGHHWPVKSHDLGSGSPSSIRPLWYCFWGDCMFSQHIFFWVRNKDDRHADILQGANPNEYFILTFEPDLIQMYLPRPDVYGNRKITFQQHSDAPLPSREALEVHCALAKILHASGMSERIDKIIQEREELKCLANDGSSDAKTLLFAFWASDSLFCLLTVIWKPASIAVRFLFLFFFFFPFKLKPSCMNLICSAWWNLAKNPFPVNTIITNWHAISYFPLAGVSLLRLVPSCLVSMVHWYVFQYMQVSQIWILWIEDQKP